ncbi:uncharacterized protein LOC121382899 [Gigantopelta aegis]|uniref:uncharacterized protein LOC121382899 n=1 Tax=Gigantopelta aegis TaxID=1735272 RepID=UPI001B88B4A7|nr:uncharacterized protein LOC121382899 [Gigantopelta aegis]
MGTNVVTLLFLATFVIVCYGWSGHVCYRRVCYYARVRRCAYQTWSACCYYRYYWVERYKYVPYCCSGWKSTWSNSQNCNTAICNPSCKNNGHCDRPGHCDCASGFDGYRCDGRTCSHLTACYPGMCQRNSDRTSTTCTCENGFGGPNCINMGSTLAPAINAIKARMSFWMRGIDNTMEKYALFVDSTMKPDTDFIWTNRVMFNWINVTAVSQYVGEDPPPKPDWIKKAEFGITEAEANIFLIKESFLDPNKKYVSKNETLKCNQTFTSLDIGPRSPAADVVNCSISLPNFDRQLENGDRLTVTFRTKSGGFREVVDAERPYVPWRTHEFTESPWTEKAVEFRFDTAKPEHCKLQNLPCADDIFSVDNDIHVTHTPIVLIWNGWTDSLSGMFRYAWEVFKLVPDISGKLHEQHPLKPLKIEEVMHANLSSVTPSYQPTGVGMYSFILEASDMANNSVFIRRLCLYDPSSEITLDSEAMKIASGTGLGKDVWTSDISSSLVVSWENHFVNKIHEDNKLLNPVKEYPQQLEDGLKTITNDDNNGTRTLRAIDNSRGIVKFEIVHAKDSGGGHNQQEPTTGWTILSPSTLSTTVTPNNPSKGDTVTIWVRATDITGRNKTDVIRVHFDDTAPNALSIVTFDKNVPAIYPFGSKVTVTVFDMDSGIHQINMTAVRRKSNAILVTHSFSIPTISTSECQDFLQDDCFCSRDQPGMCQKKTQVLHINNCWLIIPRDGLKSETVELRFQIFNNALLSVTRAVNVSNLSSLNGTEAFLGPMHIRNESLTTTGVRIAWDHAPACYERTEMWINYRNKDGKLIKKKLHKDAVYEDLTGLKPGTTYTIQLISQYGDIMSEPVDFVIVTESVPESGGLGGGAVAGIVIGVLILIILVVLLIGFLLWRTGRFPRHIRNKYKESASVSIHNSVSQTKVKNAAPSSSSVAVANNAYSPDDEIYLYGSMSFDSMQPWYVQHNDLTLVNLIHTGRFAKIYTATWKGAPKQESEVIAKLIKDDHTEDDVLTMMAKINFAATKVGEHPNILRFLGAVVDNDELGPIMVLEYCETGQLDKWLTSQQGKTTDDTIEKMQRIAMEIAQAMAYLKSRGIVHKKLAARNVLLTFVLQAKVTGFGPQRGENNEEDENSKGDRIPIKWTAPECLQTMKDANEKSDVWSYGIVLWEIFSLAQEFAASLKVLATRARKTESGATTGSSAASYAEGDDSFRGGCLVSGGSCSGEDPVSVVSSPAPSASAISMDFPAAFSKRSSTIMESSERPLKTVSSNKLSERTESSEQTEVSQQTEKTVSHRSSLECSKDSVSHRSRVRSRSRLVVPAVHPHRSGFDTASKVSMGSRRDHREHSSVTLVLLMNSLAKNQLPDQAPCSYVVQALSSIVGLDDVKDLSLCPVRALHHYEVVPFLSPKSPETHYQEYGLYLNPVFDPVCIPEEGLPAPSASNTHELRALAATMSLHCNAPIQYIFTGCFWATDSIFANYYLRDASTEDVEGFHHLGPVVAAQTLVNTSRPRRR